ncbi:MAG: hypothetical protein Kow00128_17180 [Deltaproteobacteria bacterium]
MSEGRKKREYWRRGRRKKAAEAGETPPAGAAQETAPEGPEAPEETGPEVSGRPEEPEGVAAEAPEPAPGERKGRRRRRRSRKKAAVAATGTVEAAEGEDAPEPPPIPEPPEEAVAGEPAPGELPAEGARVEAEGEASKPPRKGRRRSRRRRRRSETAAAEGEAQAPAAEEPAGAEGTVSGEAAAEEDEEEDEEAEPEAEVPEGTGPKRVMLIDGNHPEEIRVAIVREGILDYFEVENQRKKQFKGNIYRGRVVNIAPGIEAAFVEFGGGRHGFLPLNEYCGGALIENLGSWNETEKRPHLRPGMELLVQVTKEESSVKGAALTSYISIAGRYLVMMLGMKRYGISKKITGEKERERIRKQMEKLEYPENLGFIVRTVGAGRPLRELRADLANLLKLWERTIAEGKARKAPALLYEEQDIVIRTLRDQYSNDVSEVLMDSPDSQRKATGFFDVYYPKQKSRLKLYRQKRPLFSKFNLEEQVERACSRKVPLPSGGHIVIDRTEAIWSIDVNSGRSSKDRDIEDTAYRTNREAAVEVTRQLRLRDIGGLIVVDFIDMENRRHIKEVEKTIKEGLKQDKARSDVSAMGKFGLVAITRQRMGTSFHDVLMTGCETCGGTAFVPTSDASLVRLLRKVHDELSRDGVKELVVRVSPTLLEELLNRKRGEISRIEQLCGGRVRFRSDPSLTGSTFVLGNGT